jgi:hypothetical protein
MIASVRHLVSKVAADPVFARLLMTAFAFMAIVGPNVLNGGGPGG